MAVNPFAPISLEHAKVAREASHRAATTRMVRSAKAARANSSTPDNLAAAMAALRAHDALSEAFGFDEMARHVVVLSALPRVGGIAEEINEAGGRPLRDVDVSKILELLQVGGLPKLGWDSVWRAIHLLAAERSFHPIRDYLNSLRWDGKARVASWLSYYLGADDTAYTRAIGRFFVISMVARVRKPGCKADQTIVFEGPQGCFKSTTCRILASPRWFSDALPDLRSKDSSEHLRGVWVVEISELAAFRRADIEVLKAFMSRTSERYRPAYGRETVHEPRQCIFVGTTNASLYLHDPSGGRRFWPVKVGTIDPAALEHDRDQLLAEADALFLGGERWWADADFERLHCKPEQEARFEADPWQSRIEAHVANASRVKATDVAVECLGFEIKLVGTAVQRRVTNILSGLGFRLQRSASGRWYVRDGVTHDAQ